jgi:capsule polysaccharide export protein KpsE/RkpR
VQADLEHAQIDLGEFSSKNSTIDIKEQTRAMVDAGARVQAELLLEQSGLESLRQIYGNGNVRIHETEARIASLKAELAKMTGSSAPLAVDEPSNADSDPADGSKQDALYPSLRQLPRLVVPYADLYRRVKIQETLYELLTQQFEMARIEEAKDVPSVSVIDAPGIAEKKSFPPRLLVSMLLTLIALGSASALLLAREHWSTISTGDPRKALLSEIASVFERRIGFVFPFKRGDR